MIHDPRVEVTCDGKGCTESIEIQPDFVYRSMSGANGYYDCSDGAIEKKLSKEGWTAADGKHFCESCSETVVLSIRAAKEKP